MKKRITQLISILILSVFVAACSDDADFSSSPTLKLEFSSDTISFDTLFTETGSATASLLVFNRNSSSLRVDNVSLGRGAESPFRVNVDGQHGNNISDVEIRKKDSIFVFVDVMLDRNNRELPLTIKDSLIFTLESGIQQHIHLIACGRDAEVLHAPTFTTDTTLAPKAYIIHDSLTVAEGCHLTLPAGCALYFHSKAGMKIHGTLTAQGTKEQPILFRGDRTDNLFDYLPYDRVPGQWEGITFHATSNGNTLDWCDIHSANHGIYIATGDTTTQRLTMTNSAIYNIAGNALESENSHIDVGNSLIANAEGNCVKIVGGNVSFIHCTIANFYVWKQRDTALALHNTLQEDAAPLRRALFANCIITGSKNDEIMGYFSDLGDSIADGTNYKFVSSLLNTIAADEENENFIKIVWDDKKTTPVGKEHFRLIDNNIYKYDFHLDSLSTARGIADEEYSRLYPTDLDSLQRPSTPTDAGCYLWVTPPSEE